MMHTRKNPVFAHGVLVVLAMMAVLGWVGFAQAATAANQTTATTPVTPGTTRGDDSNRRMTITAKDGSGSAVGAGGDLFFVDFTTNSPSCTLSANSPTCQVTCSPLQPPHVPSPSCTSTPHSTSFDGPHFVDGSVTDNSDGTYTVLYEPEYVGTYDVDISLATAGGLNALYYDNVWFLYDPVITRVDPTINFQWGTGAITTFGVDYVSVRWSGKFRPDFTESYTIYAYADDGVRVWVDRNLIIDKWDKCCSETWATVDLTAGHHHDIIVEYYEQRGNAVVELRWSSNSVPKQIIPATHLYYRQPISGSPFQNVLINPGDPPAANKSTVSGTGLTQATAGVLANFDIQAKDIFGNDQIVQSAGGTWVLNPAGEDVSPVTSVTYTTAGVWHANYSVNIAGPYTLTYTVQGEHLPGSPANITVFPAPTSAPNSTAYGAGLSASTAGVTAFFTIQTKDQFDNNRTSASDESTDIFISLQGPAAVTGFSTSLGSGVYTGFYTPSLAGTYNVSVRYDLVHIAGSPFAMTVSPGAVHAPSSVVAGAGSSAATSGVQASFTITDKDQFLNTVLTGASTYVVTLTGPAPGLVSLATDSNAYSGSNGIYNVAYTPTVKGVWTLAITYGGLPVHSSPYSVTVSPGAAVASTSSATGAGVSACVSGEVSTFEIQARDVNSQDVEVGGATIAVTLTCSAQNDVGSATYTGADGKYTGTYTPTRVGTCSLAVTLGGSAISGSPFTVTSTPGAAATASTITTSGSFPSGVAGVESAFTINALDVNSNAKVVGGSFFVSELTGADTLAGAVADNTDGTYASTFTATVSGTYQTAVGVLEVGGLDATYYSDQTLTTVHTQRIDANVEFDYGVGNIFTGFPADYFSVQWNGKVRSPQSETFTFYTTVASDCGARVYIGTTLVIDAWDAAAGAAEASGSIALTKDEFYTIRVDFKDISGQAAITLSWESPSTARAPVPTTALYQFNGITGSPYTTTIAPAASTALTSSFTTVPSLVAGTTATFDVQLRDEFSNLQNTTNEASAITIVALHVSGAIKNGVVTHAGSTDGLYNVALAPSLSGKYVISIKHSGVHIPGSPFERTATTGVVSAANCSVTGTGFTTARAGVFAEFAIQVRDSETNVITEDVASTPNPQFSVGLTGPATLTGTVAHGGSGVYNARYKATIAGSYTMTVARSTVNVPGSPATVTVTPNTAYAATSVFSTILAGTSGSPSTFVVTLKDQQGNTHTSGGHDFFVSLTNNNGITIRATPTDNGDGTYTFTYTATTAETYTVTARLASGFDGVPEGLTGRYYNNRWLQDTPALSRVDKLVNFDWGTDLITPTGKDYVSVSWTGYVQPQFSGQYEFKVEVADGTRLYIDDVLIIDQWLAAAGTFSATYTFPTAALLYAIRLDYRENTGAASIALKWASAANTLNEQVIPQANLYADATHISGSPYDLTVN